MSIGEEESERIKALRELFEGLQSTIENAFAPSLEKWKVVEPGMEHFIDDTMKASSANAAGTLLKRLEEAGKK